jgi:phosphatidylserine decarboxylase
VARRGPLVDDAPVVRLGPFRFIREGLGYGAILGGLGLLVGRRLGLGWSLPLLGLAGLVVAFFRDPDRDVPADPGLLVSPADGTVTHVEPLPPDAEHGTRVSIFLSIFDVHVNRAPAAGRVASVEYQPGKFGNAMLAASATENERNVVRLEGEDGSVVFTQIAGLLARRIVFWPRVGDHLARGQRVGMIKFSSRTDLLVPRGAELLVRVGQHVQGGSSPIARLRRAG